MQFRDLDRTTPVGQQLLERLAERHGPAIADAARALDRVFLLGSDWAPGLWFVGGRTSDVPLGMAGVFNVAGAGADLEDALAAASGEAVERMAQVERPGDVTRKVPFDKANLRADIRALADTLTTNETWIDLVAGLDPTTSASVEVPADWCLRRRDPGTLHMPGAALSTGAAAGHDFDDAATRALLELIERDAAALWWIGGRPARRLGSDAVAMAAAAHRLAAYRRGATERATQLFDITTDLEIPVVAAISTDAGGAAFACGLACRPTRAEAAAAAVTELCQSEIGFRFAAAKREQLGEMALSETDRNHLSRAARVSCDRMPTYAAPLMADPTLAEQPSRSAALATHLAHRGAPVVLVTLVRGPIPVVKAIAPALQSYPADIRRPRLARAIAEFGGGAYWTAACALL